LEGGETGGRNCKGGENLKDVQGERTRRVPGSLSSPQKKKRESPIEQGKRIKGRAKRISGSSLQGKDKGSQRKEGNLLFPSVSWAEKDRIVPERGDFPVWDPKKTIGRPGGKRCFRVKRGQTSSWREGIVTGTET